jgi:hypothetical protein
LKDNVEELHRILERKATPVMKIRRTVFDAPQGERLDGAVTRIIEEAAGRSD